MVDRRALGLITITFDDGLLCQFENGYPILRGNRVKGVAFIPTGLVGDWYEGQPVMGLSHLRELSSAGWEIGSHTVSHPHLVKRERTQLSLPALEAELRESREWILANGFSVISLAYPFGRYNDEIAGIASRYYRYVRTTEEGLNEFSPENTRLRAFNLSQKTIERWKLAVNRALALKKWLIVTIHSVVESANQIRSGQESLCITRDALAECLQYALSSGLPVRTFHEVYKMCRDLPETVERTGGCDPLGDQQADCLRS